MILAPPMSAVVALVATATIPVLLVLLGRGNTSLRAPGLRFKVSIAIAWAAWAAATTALTTSAAIDVLAGAAIMLAATLTAFVVWSLICWGFTLNMLLTLNEAGTAVTRADWVARYTGGRAIDQITLDRLSILTALRLARANGDEFVSTGGASAAFARLLAVVKNLYLGRTA